MHDQQIDDGEKCITDEEKCFINFGLKGRLAGEILSAVKFERSETCRNKFKIMGVIVGIILNLVVINYLVIYLF